jgi:hypothetical protein
VDSSRIDGGENKPPVPVRRFVHHCRLFAWTLLTLLLKDSMALAFGRNWLTALILFIIEAKYLIVSCMFRFPTSFVLDMQVVLFNVSLVQSKY